MATFVEEIVGSGRGAMGGDGLGGGGVLTGLILGALLGNRGGLFGGNGNESTSAATELTAVLSKLGDIQAAVPLSEAQVQLALAGVQNDINTQTQMQTINLNQIINSLGQSLAAVNAGLARDIASVDTNVDRQSTSIQMAVKEDGEKTRALITDNQIAELNQRLTVAQQEALELRNERSRDRDRHGIEITMTNNQNQNQLQFQAQQQVLANLASAVLDIGQVARATNQSLIIGNTGAVTSGPQTANPTNVRA